MNENIANDDEQFVVYYHSKTVGHLPTIIANGFQFRDDAELWSLRYKEFHPNCDKLFIAKLPNANVEKLLQPTNKELQDFEAQYSVYSD